MNTKKIFLITILSLVFVFGKFGYASANAECMCSGDVSLIRGGGLIAKQAGIDPEAFCREHKGTFVDGSCKNLQAAINVTQDVCDKLTDQKAIIQQLEIPKEVSAFVDFTGSCSWGVSPSKSGCVLNKATGQEICSLENPLKSGTKFEDIIKIVITTALSIIGALTLLMLVWGGFQWLTSAGNPEKVKSGTQTMVWAIIGVVLVFASYLLLSTFTSYLTTGGN